MDAILAPPQNLPPHLQQYRFWIWLQLVAIRLYVIGLRGRLVAFTTATDRQGNVYLVHIGDAHPKPAPKTDPFAFEPSQAFLAATNGDLLMSAHPGESREPERNVRSSHLWAPAFAGVSGCVGTRIPDT